MAADLLVAHAVALAATSGLPGVLLWAARRMANKEEFIEYLLLHDETNVEQMGIDLEVIECSSEAQCAEWAARRACWRWGRYPAPGHAESTQAALKAARAQTVLCMRPGCGALVDLQTARRLARAAGHDTLEPSSGCAGAACSAKPWPARFRLQQKRMANALRGGTRTLVLRPPTIRPRVDLLLAPAALAAAVADAVLAGHAPPTLAEAAAASPAIDSPTIALPDVASPTIDSPAVDSPAVASPADASPAVASPAIALPDVASPVAASPVAASHVPMDT